MIDYTGHFIVPMMADAFYKKNKNYPPNKERDYPALLSIFNFLSSYGANDQEVLRTWENLSACIAMDPFYASKALKTISNHIQEISQIAVYGNKKPGKKSISPDTLRTKITE